MTDLKLNNIHTITTIKDENAITVVEFDYEGKHYKGQHVAPKQESVVKGGKLVLQAKEAGETFVNLDSDNNLIITSIDENGNKEEQVLLYNSAEYTRIINNVNKTAFFGNCFNLLDDMGTYATFQGYIEETATLKHDINNVHEITVIEGDKAIHTLEFDLDGKHYKGKGVSPSKIEFKISANIDENDFIKFDANNVPYTCDVETEDLLLEILPDGSIKSLDAGSAPIISWPHSEVYNEQVNTLNSITLNDEGFTLIDDMDGLGNVMYTYTMVNE